MPPKKAGLVGAVSAGRGTKRYQQQKESSLLDGYDENQKLVFVKSIKETIRPQAKEDEEAFTYVPGAVELSPKQKTHMLKLARVLMYSPVAVDTSSTGAGKTLVTINLFSHLNFSTMTIISPSALVQNWNINFKNYGIFEPDGINFYKSARVEFVNIEGKDGTLAIGEVGDNESYKNVTYDSPYLDSNLFGVTPGKDLGKEQLTQEVAASNELPYLSDSKRKTYGQRRIKTFFIYEDSGVRAELSAKFADEKTKKPGMYIRGRTMENHAWLNITTQKLYVIDEVQKLKNKSLPYWSVAALLNSVFYPATYVDRKGQYYDGTRSRVLYLSATPFDKLDHVHGFYTLNGMTRYASGVVSFPTGKVGNYLYYSTSVMEILVNILRLVESAAPYHQGTYVRNSKSLLRYNDLGDDEMVPLYNGSNGVRELQLAVIKVFEEIIGGGRVQYLTEKLADGSYKNINPQSSFYRDPLVEGSASVKTIGETLFNAYIGFCKYVLCSFVTKPTTLGIERYCSNLFVNVTEKEARLTLHMAKEYENYTERKLSIKEKTSAIEDGSAQMGFSASFRRSLNNIKAYAVARIVLDILYHTEGDKVVIFVSEDEAENILYQTISNGRNVRGQYFNCYVANGKNGATNIQALAQFQEHNSNLRVLIAKLTLFSAGQSMHDNSPRGWFPRHTFIIPDPNLTDVSQSIGRTIRVGMTTSAAVYIVYLGQFIPSVDLGEYDISLPFGGHPGNPQAERFIQGKIASGELPEDFKMNLPYGGFYHGEFGEITKVFKNLVSKTLLLRELLLDSDMDFPGDFTSITEHQLMKNRENLYDWSRVELMNKSKEGWSQEELYRYNYYVKPYAKNESGAVVHVDPGPYPHDKEERGYRAAVNSIRIRRDVWDASAKKSGNPPTLPYFAMQDFGLDPNRYGEITDEMIRALNSKISADSNRQVFGGGFGNAPMSGGFGNAPMSGNFGNAPMSGNFGNEFGGGFGNAPMSGGFGNAPMSGNFRGGF